VRVASDRVGSSDQWDQEGVEAPVPPARSVSTSRARLDHVAERTSGTDAGLQVEPSTIERRSRAIQRPAPQRSDAPRPPPVGHPLQTAAAQGAELEGNQDSRRSCLGVAITLEKDQRHGLHQLQAAPEQQVEAKTRRKRPIAPMRRNWRQSARIAGGPLAMARERRQDQAQPRVPRMISRAGGEPMLR